MLDFFGPRSTLLAARVLRIRGATSAEELAWLRRAAATVRNGCIVEIGSYQGRSTAALISGALLGTKPPLYAVEPHAHFEGMLGGRFGPSDRTAFFRNMVRLGLAEHVHLINLSSELITPAWTMKVGLLWIDGDHRPAAVQRDLACWLPHLADDCMVIFDDAAVEGPREAIAGLEAGDWTMLDRTGKTATLARTAFASQIRRRLAAT